MNVKVDRPAFVQVAPFARVAACLVAFLAVAASCNEALAPNTSIGIRVWAEASPAVVHLSDTAAAVHIRIFAENPTGAVIRLRSGGPPYVSTLDPSRGRGFAEEYRLALGDNAFNAGPVTDWGWDTVYVFSPHSREYAEAAIQVRSWNPNGVPPDTGTYVVRSYYNQHEGTSTQFRIVP